MKELFPYKQYNGWHFRYYISFVEEAIQNPKYFCYTAGRCEVDIDEKQFSIDEYRFFTKKKSFKKFRELVECHYYNIIGLFIIKLIIKYVYNINTYKKN